MPAKGQVHAETQEILMLDDLSSIWYTKDSEGRITYTKSGREVYGPLFEAIGINIEEVTTPEQHEEAVAATVREKMKNAPESVKKDYEKLKKRRKN
jgi:hypothetical protein